MAILESDVRRSGAIPRCRRIQRDTERVDRPLQRAPGQSGTAHFAGCEDTDEDRTTVLYLRDCSAAGGP